MKLSNPIEELKSRYERLLPVPAIPGEREWVDRVTTYDDFLKMGPEVIESLKKMGEEDRQRVRKFATELYDLLMEAFSK